jgi:hypothetical protein
MLAEKIVVYDPSHFVKRLLSFGKQYSCDEMMGAQVSEYLAHERDVLYGPAILCQGVEDIGKDFWRQQLNWGSRHDGGKISTQAMRWQDELHIPKDDGDVRSRSQDVFHLTRLRIELRYHHTPNNYFNCRYTSFLTTYHKEYTQCSTTAPRRRIRACSHPQSFCDTWRKWKCPCEANCHQSKQAICLARMLSLQHESVPPSTGVYGKRHSGSACGKRSTSRS